MRLVCIRVRTSSKLLLPWLLMLPSQTEAIQHSKPFPPLCFLLRYNASEYSRWFPKWRICNLVRELADHLLYKCGFTTWIWKEILEWCGCHNIDPASWTNEASVKDSWTKLASQRDKTRKSMASMVMLVSWRYGKYPLLAFFDTKLRRRMSSHCKDQGWSKKHGVWPMPNVWAL
jgi:hypothetical protein